MFDYFPGPFLFIDLTHEFRILVITFSFQLGEMSIIENRHNKGFRELIIELRKSENKKDKNNLKINKH